MSLIKALRVGRGAVVSFVGGGGKTTAMFRLATESSAAGLRTVTTTTTHIAEHQVLMSPASIGIDELQLLDPMLDRHGQCLIVGPPDGKGRVFGVPARLVSDLHARPGVDVVVVEADGSRSLPFKAPGPHEPVVPDVTTVLSPIAGVNALGQPLDDAHVHRAGLAAALSHQEPGSPVTEETLARVLTHREGGAKSLPSGARLVPILNKVDTQELRGRAARAAEAVLKNPVVDAALLCSMHRESPVLEAWVPVAGIVLDSESTVPESAAGGEEPAALAAQTALAAGLDPVVVVMGRRTEMKEESLAGLPVQKTYLGNGETGRAALLRAAMGQIPSRTGAAVVLPAGRIRFTIDAVRALVQAHRESIAAACVGPAEGEKHGPVLFDSSLFAELAGSRGDAAEEELLQKHAAAVVHVPFMPQYRR